MSPPASPGLKVAVLHDAVAPALNGIIPPDQQDNLVQARAVAAEVASALHSSLAQANAARALHDLASAEAHHAMFARRVYESFVSAADKLAHGVTNGL